MTKNTIIQSLLIPSLLVTFATVLTGQQTGQGKMMTASQCEGIRRAVVDSNRFSAIGIGSLRECVPQRATALAEALRKTKTISLNDTGTMDELLIVATEIRDAEVFNVVRAVAMDDRASALSRITSLHILVRYYNARAVFLQSLEDMARGPVICKSLKSSGNPRAPMTNRPLPANANLLIARAADTIARRSSTPPQIRQMARCIQVGMALSVPSDLPPNAITLLYQCGKTFTVTNTLDEPIFGNYVKITLTDTTLNWPLALDPKTSQTFSFPKAGTVQVLEHGEVIAQAANLRKACTPQRARTIKNSTKNID